MAYIHQLRHRNLHKMDGEVGNIVARDPQRSETSTKDSGSSRTDSKSDSKTETADTPPSTFLSVVFVTATPTFTGEIAGFTTLTPSAEESAQESTKEASFTYFFTEPQSIESSTSEYIWTPASSSETSASAPAQTTVEEPIATSQQAATTTAARSTTIPAVVGSSSSASPVPTSIVVAVSSSTLLSSYSSYSRSTRSLSSMTSTSTASGVAEASTSEGMTSGGKVGLAIGIILVVAVLAGSALWFYWKKNKGSRPWKKAKKEKAGFEGVAAAATKGPSSNTFGAGAEKNDSSAPRLSLRPVTQFIPDLASTKKRLSKGNPLNVMNKPAGMAAVGAGRNLTPNQPNGSPWERQIGGEKGGNPFKDPVNPFGDQANAPGTPNVTVTPPASDDGSSTIGGTGAAIGAAAGVGIAAGALTQGNSQSRNNPGSSQGGAAAAGSPPLGNVHRVQLDFKPSMEDELELCAGQLVRLLHEYDDGWALCLRLDRTQQGVAPRTCLSARPVKPRPANGPPRIGTNGRPMSPAKGSPRKGPGARSMSPRPMNPAQGRPVSPAGGPGPRPSSPANNHGTPRPATPNGNHGPSRPGTANSNHSLSPLGQVQTPMMPQKSNPTSPGQFNQAPRPLSPGPIGRSPISEAPKRSQSPGPYGAKTGPTPMITDQRRRSNSAGAAQAKRNIPAGSSPLGREDPMPGWKPPKPQNGPGVAF